MRRRGVRMVTWSETGRDAREERSVFMMHVHDPRLVSCVLWCVLVYSEVLRHSIVLQCTLMCTGVHLYTLACYGKTLVYSGVLGWLWHTLLCSSVHWCIQAYSSILWCTMVCFGVLTYFCFQVSISVKLWESVDSVHIENFSGIICF